MKTLKITVLALAVSAASFSAFAQEAASGSDAVLAGPGISAGATPLMPLKFVNIQGMDLMTSSLVGVDIYNAQNEVIGEISDFAIGDGKSLIGVVASVGGFLGLGTAYVVLDPASIALTREDGTWKAHVDTSKDDLSNAPTLDYEKIAK